MLLLAALAVVARAAPPTDAAVAAAFGLPGRWAVDCGKPVGPANPQYVYRTTAAGGIAAMLTMHVHEIDGPSTLTRLKVLPGDMLRVVWTNDTSGAASTITLRRVKGRMASWQSVGSGGEIYVKDGVFPSTGKPAQWFARCG